MLLTLINGAASGQDSLSSSATKNHPLGTVAMDMFGGIYRYCQAGAADTVAGSLYQSAAPVANHLANTPPAVAIGARSFSYTPGATAGAENLYADGYLQVDTTPGNGVGPYSISGHPAITSATAFTLTLNEPIAVALTTSSRVGLLANPFKNVIISATTVTAPVVGWSVAVITATQYGWLKTRGPVSALINGTPGVGIGLVSGATTAGSVDVAAVAAEINVRIIARAMQVCVSTKNNNVYAMLD